MTSVLIVDDDPMARELVATVLGYAGYASFQAADGADALARAQETQPDLIIADLLMPTMDGFEFVRQLRENMSFVRTPVVFYSASYLESEARALARSCGVVQIITKPADPERILAAVGEALGVACAPIQPPPPLEEFRRAHLSLLTTKLSRESADAVHRLEVIIEMNLQMAAERDPSDLLAFFCATSRKVVGARHATVAELNANATVRFGHTSGMDPATAERVRVTPPSRVLEDIFSDRFPTRMQGLAGDPTLVGLPHAHPPVDSLLCAPITSTERLHGWVCLTGKLGSTAFSDEDEGLLRILALQVGRAYENRLLYAEVHRHAEQLEQEIAERRRTDEALRESEQRYRRLIDEAQDAIFTVSFAGEITSLNPAFESITGWSRQDWIGKPLDELVHADDRPALGARLDEARRGRKPPVFEVSLRARGNTYVVCEFNMTPRIRRRQLSDVLGVGRDVTRRKELETELRHAQKMESIGRLAGEVAHDFNNLLTVIQGHASLALMSELNSADAAKAVREISLAAERAAGLTRQLLTFSRRQAMQLQNIDVNDAVRGIHRMLELIIGNHVKLEVELSPMPAIVRGDLGMLEQVLVNLATNARDAMPDGGTLTITVTNEQIAEPGAEYANQADIRCVCLSVRDTGCGIPIEAMGRIFEPFYTTKDLGKGTGLGLATVHGIVKQHNGHIEVMSEVCGGTTFRTLLPALSDQAAKPLAHGPGGTETILVVDDQSPLRYLGMHILEPRGYRVVVADSGTSAIQAWDAERGKIDLVIANLVMPDGLSGRELGQRLIRENANLKVILTSSYDSDAHLVESAANAGFRFLRKPFDADQLLRTVRECLDRR